MVTSAGGNDFRIRSAGLGTREIAPGAREYVISFEYQPLVDLSADPPIAARQYAACAAALATSDREPDARRHRALFTSTHAEHYVALAASVLGERAARASAAETRGGPVLRDLLLKSASAAPCSDACRRRRRHVLRRVPRSACSPSPKLPSWHAYS